MPYHVSLELTADEVADLKMTALKKRTTVKGFVTDLVKGSLNQQSGESVAGDGRRGEKSANQKT